MDIIVNDTNIFIDLHSIGLLDCFCELPYEIRTVDFVMAEISNPLHGSGAFGDDDYMYRPENYSDHSC